MKPLAEPADPQIDEPPRADVEPEVFRQLRESGWPDALVKATMDEFDYALRLRTGETVYFSQASDDGAPDWVHLDGVTIDGQGFERGLDVRLSEIAWVADAAKPR